VLAMCTLLTGLSFEILYSDEYMCTPFTHSTKFHAISLELLSLKMTLPSHFLHQDFIRETIETYRTSKVHSFNHEIHTHAYKNINIDDITLLK